MKMKPKNAFHIRIQTLLLALAALAGGQMSMAADHYVAVYFQNGCPELDQQVYTATVEANGSDTVIWTAIDRASNQPMTTGYTIYFDPFKDGKPLKDNDGDGKIKSTPVDSATPKGVEFKYTIVGDLSDCISQPLDPVLRVQN